MGAYSGVEAQAPKSHNENQSLQNKLTTTLAPIPKQITLPYVRISGLDLLEVVAWNQSWPLVFACNLSLPPTIILQSQDSKGISLPKAELLRDCSRVVVLSARYKQVSNMSIKKISTNIPKCIMGRPSLLNCLLSATLLLRW